LLGQVQVSFTHLGTLKEELTLQLEVESPICKRIFRYLFIVEEMTLTISILVSLIQDPSSVDCRVGVAWDLLAWGPGEEVASGLPSQTHSAEVEDSAAPDSGDLASVEVAAVSAVAASFREKFD
jgi:hypothetical protein